MTGILLTLLAAICTALVLAAPEARQPAPIRVRDEAENEARRPDDA